VHGLRAPVEVHAVGVDDDQLRAALADRLLYAEVDDWDVVLQVGGDHDNDARVIYLLHAHRFAIWRRDGGAAVHLHLRTLQRTVEQAAEEECLLVRDVLGQRDAEPGAFALDAGGDGVDRIRPRGPGPPARRRAQPRRVVDVGVVEAAAIADPALVDVVGFVCGDAYQLASALPL